MTAPRTGDASADYFRELAQFNATRDSFYQNLLNGMQQARGASPQFSGMTAPQRQTAATPDLSSMPDPDLLGAAKFWGIPEEVAIHMPREQLISIVQDYRSKSRPDENSFMGRLGAAPAMLAALPAQVAIGAGEAITGGLGNLPLVGPALKRTAVLHAADSYFRQLEEGVRASTPESFQWVESGANIAGNVGAMWFPASGAWKLAGGYGRLASVVGNPIARAAIQGGASAYLLEGGSENPLAAVAGGAILGPAFEAAAPYLEAAATKITKHFVVPEMFAAAPADLRATTSGRTKLAQMAASGDEQAAVMLDALGTRPTRAPDAVADLQAQLATETDPTQKAELQRLLAMVSETRATTPEVIPKPTRAPEAFRQDVMMAPTHNDPLDRSAELGRLLDQKMAMTEAGVAPEVIAPVDAQIERIRQGYERPPQYPPAPPTPALDETQAATLASQMNKASTIVESPVLPEIAKQIKPDELSVAHAAIASNPGGSNVIEGVSNPASFVASLGENVAFAQRNRRLAAIVSDQPITPKIVSEFEAHGMYSGQTVLTSGGNPAEILDITPNGVAQLKYPYSEIKFTRPVSDLSPQVSSPGVHAVPELWSSFQNFANLKAAQAELAMGTRFTPDHIKVLESQNLALWMEDFMDSAGIVNPSDRARVGNYFNQQWVGTFRSAAPVEAGMNLAAVQESANIAAANPKTPLGSLDENAATKGFIAIPNGRGGYVMQNVASGAGASASPVSVQFDSIEAADAWIKGLNRSLPDISPASEVPGELAGVLTRNPPAEINTNHRFEPDIHASTMDMAEGGVPPVPPHEIAQAQAEGNFGKMQDFWQQGFSKWSPQRRIMAQIGGAMQQHLGDDFGVTKIYDQLGVLRNQMQYHAHEPQNRLSDILSHVSTKRLLTGEWTRVYEILDDGERLAAATKAGWSKKEIDSLGHFNDLMKSLFPDTGLDPNRELRQYITHMAQRKSMGSSVPWDDFPVGPSTAPWYKQLRTGSMDVREMDPRRLGESYIRAVMWDKHMSAPFDAALAQMKQLQEVPETFAAGKFMENWMGMLKNGYDPKDDIALDGVHRLGQFMLGSSFSRQQAKELVSFGMNATHASFLGYRIHVMARDALQLFFAIPRAGPELMSTMLKYTSNPEFRKTILERALTEGAVSPNMPSLASPGQLAGELEASSVGMAPEQMSKRMKALGAVSGAIRDILPDFIKGSSDNILKPMYLYSKQQEVMKALVYEAGRSKAEAALAAYRAAGPAASMDELMGASGARTFDPAWQTRFKQLVTAGDDEGAKRFLGRQLADATQFKFGLTENPAVNRTLTGKVFMQFGSYQTQYLQYLRESLANGSQWDRAKVLLMGGTVSAMLKAASDATGWNFNYMNPYALGFAGGPMLAPTLGMLQGASAVARAAMGQDRPMDARLVGAGGAAAGQMASMMNPLAGAYGLASTVGGALADSPNPLATIGRYAMTGERGAGPEVMATLMPSPESGMPQQNPVRMGGTSFPTAQPMVPSYPGGVNQALPNQSGNQQVPALVPLPGGSANSNRPSPAATDIDLTVRMALMGSATAASLLPPDDQAMLAQLKGVPVDSALLIFHGYQRDKALQMSRPNSTNQVNPGYAPRAAQPSPAGGGGQF